MTSFTKVQSLLLLLGLFVFLVEAAPTKPAAGKKQCKRRAGLPPPRPPKKGAVAAPAKGSTSKTSVTSQPKKISKRGNHPSAKGKITLFHGTESDFGDLNFQYASTGGDFHFGKRAFYLTDTLKHAAQYACVSYCLVEQGIADATVIEYTWDGSNNIHEFTGLSDPKWAGYQAWVKADGNPANSEYSGYHSMDMVTGPMRSQIDIDNKMAADFWQYTLLSETAAKAKLHRVKVHQVPCKDVAPGSL